MLNTGKYYKRPYESDWNVIQRFYFSNPILCERDIDDELYAYVDEKFPNLDHSKFTRYDYILEINYPDEKPYHLFKSSFFLPGNHRVSRICPECEKQLFHSYIFSFEWLTHCPIHKTEIVQPTINMEQFSNLTENKKHIGLKNVINREKIVYMNTEPLHVLYTLIAQKKFKKYESALVCSCLWDITGIHNTHIDYPSVLDSLSDSDYKTLKKYGINRSPVKIIFSKLVKRNRSPIEPFLILQESKKLLLSDWAKKIRNDVTNSILNDIRISCNEKHDVSLCYKSSNRFYGETCPYCLSFSLWFYRILGDDHSMHSKGSIDSIYADFYDYDPDPPHIITTIERHDKIYKLPLKLTKLLYQKNIEWLFYNMYSYISHVIQYFTFSSENQYTIKDIQNMLRTMPSEAAPNNIGFR